MGKNLIVAMGLLTQWFWPSIWSSATDLPVSDANVPTITGEASAQVNVGDVIEMRVEPLVEIGEGHYQARATIEKVVDGTVIRSSSSASVHLPGLEQK